jgi:hypothetical protein
MVREGRREAVDRYRRFPEMEKQLRSLEALCKAHPEECH